MSHVDLVDKLQKNSKILSKNVQNVLKELAVLEAEKLKSSSPPPRYFVYHRKEAEPDFMSIFIKEVCNPDIFLFLSTGDEKGSGNIVLYGNEDPVKELGNKYLKIDDSVVTCSVTVFILGFVNCLMVKVQEKETSFRLK